MPNIAIVGTEGSGKTVFITTLAKRFSIDNPLGAFMNPQGRKTIQYVEQVWHTLSNSEWPPSTSPGELFDLKWTIHWQDGLVGDIRLVDCAGQDLRLLFADEQASSDNIPSHLKQLAEYCRSAHIMLLMVNLKDFMGESDDERRTANEWAIKYALDMWKQNRTAGHVAVVFSQVDQYQEVVRQHGGWKAVLKEHLPYVYGAHLRNGNVTAMAVASVNNTHVAMDGASPRWVPDRNFRSSGLNEMVTWIGQQLRSVTEEEQQRIMEEQRQEALRAQQEEHTRRTEQAERTKKKLLGSIKGIAGFVLVLVLIIKGCDLLSSGPSSVPIPKITWRDIFDDLRTFTPDRIVVKAKIRNDGAGGNIRFTVWATDDATGNVIDTQAQSIFLNAGQESDVIEVDLTTQDTEFRNPHHTHIQVDVPGSK